MKTALLASIWRVTEMVKGKLETIVAIICITILEIIALIKGIDGMFLSTVIAVLAGLGGFWLGRTASNGSNANP